MQALDINNLPTPKIEEWKYTNLGRVLPKDLQPGDAHSVVIHKSRGEVCEQAEDILFAGVAGTAQAPRLKVVLEEGASLTMIERHDGQGAYWKNMICEIELGPNARLEHIRIQDDSAEGINILQTEIKLDRDAHYNGFTLNVGGRLTRHEITALIQGENAEASFNGLNLLNGKQHGDTTILIEHQAPNTRSNQFYRTLLDDEAHGVFQGKVHVHQIAQKTDGYQLSNALLLSDKAEMDTKPELEIYADDVKCSHGATTGQLDDEPLFYLRTRGLSGAEARRLILQAFVDEVVDKIVDKDLQTQVKDICCLWLEEVL